MKTHTTQSITTLETRENGLRHIARNGMFCKCPFTGPTVTVTKLGQPQAVERGCGEHCPHFHVLGDVHEQDTGFANIILSCGDPETVIVAKVPTKNS